MLKEVRALRCCIIHSTHFSIFSVLKDVPIIPSESYGPRQRDSVRLSVFPNLNYSGLYDVVMSMIEVVPLTQLGTHGEYSHLPV